MYMFLRYKHGVSLWSKNGEGIYWGKYTGKVKDGKPNGKGKVLYPDGRKINGEYKNGHLDGQATITYPDGRKLIGEFRKDKPWNVIVYDNAGNITAKIVNGKIEK